MDDRVRGERGGEEVGSVGREGEGCWGVRMSRESVYLFAFADVIYLKGILIKDILVKKSDMHVSRCPALRYTHSAHLHSNKQK